MISHASYHGPQSGLLSADELRTGEPAYRGGRIYPVNAEATAKLRAYYGAEEPRPRPREASDNVVTNLMHRAYEKGKMRTPKVSDDQIRAAHAKVYLKGVSLADTAAQYGLSKTGLMGRFDALRLTYIDGRGRVRNAAPTPSAATTPGAEQAEAADDALEPTQP